MLFAFAADDDDGECWWCWCSGTVDPVKTFTQSKLCASCGSYVHSRLLIVCLNSRQVCTRSVAVV